jgi:hypothetical protein
MKALTPLGVLLFGTALIPQTAFADGRLQRMPCALFSTPMSRASSQSHVMAAAIVAPCLC